MKQSRRIAVKVDNWQTEYRLDYRYKVDKEYAVLHCPYTKWISPSNASLAFRKFRIEDKKLLERIEKEFFDKDRTSMPVLGHGYISIEAIVSKTCLPENVRKSVIDGTFEESF